MSDQDEFEQESEPRHPFDVFELRRVMRQLQQQRTQNLQDFLNTSKKTLRNAINANEELSQRGKEARERLADVTGLDLSPEGLIQFSLRYHPTKGADNTVGTGAEAEDDTPYYYETSSADLQELEEGTVFTYPVRIDQHIPDIGYLVSDEFGSNRSYWLTEAGVANEAHLPRATATVKSMGNVEVIVTVHNPVGSTPLERTFDLDWLIEGLMDGAVSVLNNEETLSESTSTADEGSADQPTSFSVPVTNSDDTPEQEEQQSEAEKDPEPEVGMRVEIEVWLHRVIDGYAALVSDNPNSQQYSVRLSDVELPENYDDGGAGKLAKIRGTVTSVTEERIYVELFSPSDQYERHYSRPLEVNDVSEPEKLVPGNLYRSYGKFDTMVYDGEYFIPMATFPKEKKTRAELPKRLQDLGHIYDNM